MSNCPYLQNALAWSQGLKADIMKQKSLGYVLFLAVGASVLSGLAVFLFDPNVRSFSDGVWYAWATITHVGYGDVVPTSLVGRLLSSLLILFGLVQLTATFSAIHSGRNMGERPSEDSQILAEIKRLHERQDQLEAKRRPTE